MQEPIEYRACMRLQAACIPSVRRFTQHIRTAAVFVIRNLRVDSEKRFRRRSQRTAAWPAAHCAMSPSPTPRKRLADFQHLFDELLGSQIPSLRDGAGKGVVFDVRGSSVDVSITACSANNWNRSVQTRQWQSVCDTAVQTAKTHRFRHGGDMAPDR